MNLTAQVGIIHSKQGFSPWLIRIITRSWWTHVIVAINDTQCVSAEPGGAVVRPISEYTDIAWSHFDHTPRQRAQITVWAAAHVGTPYSWVDFYIAGLGALLKDHTPAWVERIAAGTDRLICSQFCDLALQAAGIHLFQDERPRGAVTPASFGRIFHRNGWAHKP